MKQSAHQLEQAVTAGNPQETRALLPVLQQEWVVLLASLQAEQQAAGM